MDAAATTEPLLERGAELARIESALAEARAGRGRFLVLEGPAGIGKTALLAAARRRRRRAACACFVRAGAELERDFAFGVVRQLFEPLLDEASDRRARRPAARRRRGGGRAARSFRGTSRRGPARVGPDASFAVLHGLYWLCANLAAAGPLCLIVDDAHWADAPRCASSPSCSRAWRSWTPRSSSRPARRGGYRRQLLATLTADPSADVVRRAPLTRAAVAGSWRRGSAWRPMPASPMPASARPAACPSSCASSSRR